MADDQCDDSPDDLNRDGVVSPREVYPEPGDKLRQLAVNLLIYACNGGDVGEFDPRYVEITEGRDPGPGYSSCADLAHWLYFRLGVRAPWINRAEHKGFVRQVNVARLVTAAVDYGGLADYPTGSLQNRWAARTGGDTKAQPGDVIIVANDWPSGKDAHVVCIREPLEGRGYLTAEYGLPGGGLRERDGFKRTQRVWLPLLDVIEHVGACGQLVAPNVPEGVAIPEGLLTA